MKCARHGSWPCWSQQNKYQKGNNRKKQPISTTFQVFIRRSLKRYNHISMHNTTQSILEPLFQSQEDSANWIPYAQEVKLLNTSSSNKKKDASVHSDPIEQLLQEVNFWNGPYDSVQQNQKMVESQFDEINAREQEDGMQNGQETQKRVKKSMNIIENKVEEETEKAEQHLYRRKKIINKDYQKRSEYCLKKAKITKTNKNLSKLLIRLYFKYRSVSKKNCPNNTLSAKFNQDQLSNSQRKELRALKKSLKKHNFHNGDLQFLAKLFHDSEFNSLNRQFFSNVLSQSKILQKQIVQSSLIKNQRNRKAYLMGIKVMKLRMRSKQLACRIENC